MNKLVDALSWVAMRCTQNKYLNAIKNTFQNYMPISLTGAVGIFWINVLVNDRGGLGAVFPLIMELKIFNPIFEALNYAAISCISIVIVLLLSSEIAQANGDHDIYPVIVSFLSWLVVTPHTIDGLHINVLLHTGGGAIVQTKLSTFVHIPHSIGITLKDFTAQGIGIGYTSLSGLFTAMLVAIIATELYHLLRNCDCLLIKLPSQVSTNQVLSFMNIVPTFLTLLIMGSVSYLCILSTGHTLNTNIYNLVQFPLQLMAGDNLIAVLVLYFIILLFWVVGFHGKNLMLPIVESLYRPLLYINMASFNAGLRGKDIPYVFNSMMFQMFGEVGGSGCTLGLVIYILVFSQRHDNRLIANISLFPSLANINETVIFGMPIVLNPLLSIPFILAPLVSLTAGYFLISIGFCPHVIMEVPWVMPPILMGFLVTGGSIYGANITSHMYMYLSTCVCAIYLYI
jgi:Phosphotransferase system cellobiose-specific component IIC